MPCENDQSDEILAELREGSDGWSLFLFHRLEGIVIACHFSGAYRSPRP